MGRAAKVQSFFESAMTDFTEQLLINGKAKVGKNVTLYPGVCVGQKSPSEVPEIGDNCFIGLSAKVMGKVKVGNNVTIAPNAVVTHDVPDNCVVAGVPAKIIKYKLNE